MTNSQLLYASTRRCVRAQPWGVSPHPRRAQRDVGPCCLSQAHQALSAVSDYVIYGRRLASGQTIFRCGQTPIGVCGLFVYSRLYPLREIHRSTVASLERSKYPGLQAPLGSLRGRSPATTCRHTRADCRARLRQTILLPAHPLCSIRRSQDHGVSRPIASPAWQLLGLAVLHPCTSLVRSRHPAASELASESHLRSPGGISGPAGHRARGTACRAGLDA